MPSPSSGRAGPGRPSDARARLVRAATSYIFAHSYAGATVDDLCAKAGVGKSSFYHFFASKHELALAALDHYWERLKVRIIAPAFADDVPPRDRVARLFDLAYESQRAFGEATGSLAGCLVGNMTLEMAAQDEAIRAKVDAILTEWVDIIERALREAVAAGALPQIDPQTAAQALIAYLEGVLLIAKGHNDPAIIRRLRSGVGLLSLIGSEGAPAG